MDSFDSKNTELRRARLAVWQALITVHAVFLAAASAVIVHEGDSSSGLLVAVAWMAFLAVTIILLCMATTFTALQEELDPNEKEEPKGRAMRWLRSAAYFPNKGVGWIWPSGENIAVILLFVEAVLLAINAL